MSPSYEEYSRFLPDVIITFINRCIDSAARFLIKLKFTANAVTMSALGAGIGAGILFYLRKPFYAGILVMFSGFLDVLDGKVALFTNRSSKFGAIFDSTLDRYCEFFIYLGIAMYFRFHWAIWLAFFAILGSNMVSYTRARAEGLGFECRIGLMQRGERMIGIILASLIGGGFHFFEPAVIGVLILIGLFSNFTACQRLFHVRRMERQKP